MDKEDPKERYARWEALKAAVEQITDRLGERIDAGIKEPVVALRAFEFPTSQSCEGHLATGHGTAYPWVEIDTPEPEGWQEDEAGKAEWTRANLAEQQRIISLLEEFYTDRQTSFDVRLSFDRIGAFGGFRVQSTGANTMELLTPEQQKEKYHLYLKEMRDFAEFLKNKFLST